MTPPRGDIAIIGMACTFPGARDVHEYWENILRKHDAVSDPPADWEAERYFDPVTDRNDRTYCKRGGYLGQLASFDPTLHGVMPQSVDGSEPDHFLALRAATEALTDAGYRDNPKYRERTEVIIGRGTYVNRGNTTAVQHSLGVDSTIDVLRQLHPEYSEAELDLIRAKLHESLPPFHADTAPGLVPNIISGRIANRLDIMGPNYIVDAACASSLVAVELGVRDLLSGHCDMVIAGGVHASTPPVILIIFSQLKALSRSGKIRPFGGDADGTLLGEGVGMTVLKRLEDAERDGDQIYAVIKGVGTASDGRALGLLAPRLEGETLALRRAYEASEVDPFSVGLVEAHGTATLVGDATEVEALKSLIGPRRGPTARCALGSVKSMISHTMPASGMAGLIKAALALRHKVLPPTLHCENPNPKLGLENSNFYLNTETRPWIHGGAAPRRAGVNAFGFGGINAHAVLEEYTGPRQSRWLQHNWPSELFVFSGETQQEMAANLTAFRRLVQDAPESVPLNQLAYTAVHRPLGRFRLSLLAESRSVLLERLERAAEKIGDPKTERIREKDGVYFFAKPVAAGSKLAFVFPGEGGQYPGMLADLAVHFPEVREWFDLMDSAFQDHPRGYLPSEDAFPSSENRESRLWTMDVGAETVFCSNMGLFTLLRKLGIRPDAMVGHSTGEHSALLAAGAISLPEREQRVKYVLGVNEVFEHLNVDGKIEAGLLLAVAGAGRKFLDEIVSASNGALYIALDNCPNQVVLCGSEPEISSVMTRLTARSAICQRLPMDRAYHTPQFASFAGALRRYLDTVAFAKPEIDLYSCVTASRFPADSNGMRELASRSWAETVRFRETINAMHGDGIGVFIECGPRGNLTSFVSDSLSGKEYLAMPANVQHRPGLTQLHHLIGLLVARGVDVDLSFLHARRNPIPYEQPASSPKRPTLTINSGLQALRLPSDFIPIRPVPVTPQTAVEPIPAVAAPTAPPSSAVNAYFENMRQFLAINQQVFTQFSALATGPSQRVPVPGFTPFLGEIVELVSGARARVLCPLSLAKNPLFAHHTLGRKVSESDESLSGLPIVPLTVTMEILAEAASLLAPGQVLTGIDNFSSSRWITLESPKEFELSAVVLKEPGSIRVQFRPVGSEPIRPIWAEGTFRFAAGYPQHSGERFSITGLHASAWSPERLYIDGMFHGPLFQAVRQINQSCFNGNVSTLDVLRRDELIAGMADPHFLLDPVILDAAGQCVAFWTQEEFEAHGDIFPFFFDRLQCFGPPATPGATLECRVRSRTLSSSEVHTDLQITDGTGRVLYILENWKDRRFTLPRMLWDLRTKSDPVPIAETWPNISGVFRNSLSSDVLEASHEIWSKMLAHIILGREERRAWQSLASSTPASRSSWLRERCAAKEAIRNLIRRRRGVDLLAADVQIVGEAGLLTALVSHPEAQGLDLYVSTSSVRDIAAATATANDRVDLELKSAALSQAPAELPLTAREVELFRAKADNSEWRLRAWSAKAAALKHIGSKPEELHSLKIISWSEETGEFKIGKKNEISSGNGHDTERGIVVRTIYQEPVVLAVTQREDRQTKTDWENDAPQPRRGEVLHNGTLGENLQ